MLLFGIIWIFLLEKTLCFVNSITTVPQYCADISADDCSKIDCSWSEAKKFCPKKCGACRICEDTKTDCTFLKENNLCTSHQFLQIAAKSCPESCNFCTPCHDTHHMQFCAGLKRYCNSQTTVAVACEKTCNRCKPYNMTEIIEKFGGYQIQTTISSTTIASTTIASTTASSTTFTTTSGTTVTGICEDTKTDCTFLKENNLCTSHQFLQIAAKSCPGSCNFCTPCHDTLGMDVCAGLKSYCNERTSVADACRKTCNRCKPYNMTEIIEKFGGNQIQTTIASTTASGTTATAMVTNSAGPCSDNEVPGFSCAEWKGLGICSSTSGSESIIAKERCQKTCGFCS
ncbi:uncharacterized protein ZK643.6-like isoform X2 [Ruditapes philippinarum]|uniref:uncharacterized protein ZK643.6-like isoform X2 n=1 Tax=Ruditapes philippinarum TaxID=129788 RepID=UPI00295BB57D|nr:uncharacterized protein ZK643.6-like isoform X2 [Ruditapes philippinarum]